MLFLGTVYQPSLNINLPAPHPAEAFETVISVGIGSLGDALIIDADGVVWNQMVESYECNEPQWYAPQADAVWNPYWVRFLLRRANGLSGRPAAANRRCPSKTAGCL